MNKYLVSINDLPPAGKEFTISDQQVWETPIKEFKMDCSIINPLNMTLFIMNADDGCLVRGKLTGTVTVPCNRCAENATINIDSTFDEYEEIPESQKHKTDSDHIVFEKGVPMLNIAEVAWEQFMLSLPQSPLCSEECKGLCPKCGANLNAGNCECDSDSGDERFAILRNLKIGKKQD